MNDGYVDIDSLLQDSGAFDDEDIDQVLGDMERGPRARVTDWDAEPEPEEGLDFS